MKRKLFTITIMLILACMLLACGNKGGFNLESMEDASRNEGGFNLESMEDASRNGGVSKSQLIQDINNCEEIQSVFTSNYVLESKYVLKQCSIVKEQLNLDKKEDIIYCEATIENDYFIIGIDVNVVYNYYDIGGWIMEKNTFEKTNVIAKKPPEADKLYGFIKYHATDPYDIQMLCFYIDDNGSEYGGLTGGELKIVDSVLDDNCINATVNCIYESDCVNAKGKYTLFLDSEKGWTIPEEAVKIYGGQKKTVPILVAEYNADFSSALGDFIWQEDGLFIKYSVHEITDEYVIYSMTSNWENGVEGEKQGEYIMTKFEPLYGQFHISNDGMLLTYNASNDTWYHGYYRICERVN